MAATAIQNAFQLGDRKPLDRWLRFAAPIQARYDEENARRRVSELRSAIFIGLALYNAYNITSAILLPDVFLLSVVLRLGLITPTSLALAWLIGRTSPLWTERIVAIGVTNAYLVPLFLFWFSREPLSLFTFGELALTIVFANMLLALRFLSAVFYTLGVLSMTLLAVATKTDLPMALGFAFSVQITTACAFALYANFRNERRRCADFLIALEATLEARSAHAARQAYLDLSRTDALTRLPNRRHLMERLEEWFSEGGAVAVMMMDIDYFKLYNDALGHPAGDDCLQSVANAFERIVSRTEGAFCARFGGEEFTFVLRDASEMDAARTARSIIDAIAQLRIPHPARSDGEGILTISIGVARGVTGKAQSVKDILAAADRALYAAKRRGRNRFVLSDGADQSFQIRQ